MRIPSWTRRVRGVVGTGLTWAVGWAVGGVATAAFSTTPWLPWEAVTSVYDAPAPTLALPGFLAGVLFALVLRVVAQRRRVESFTYREFAAWGALGGALLALMPAAMAAVGFLHTAGRHTIAELTAVLLGPLTLLCAVSAVATLWVARRGAATGGPESLQRADDEPRTLGAGEWDAGAAAASDARSERTSVR